MVRPERGRAVPSEVRLNAAALSWVAALIHALAASDHFAEYWQTEGLGALDVAATVDELAILATAFAYLRGHDRWLSAIYRTPVAPLLVFASLLAAMSGHRQ